MVGSERYYQVIDEATSLYEQGYSTVEIGKKFNISYVTIAKYLRKNNVKMRHCGLQVNSTGNKGGGGGIGKKTKIPTVEIIIDLLKHMTVKEIAKKYNCHVGSIYNKLFANGIRLRPGSFNKKTKIPTIEILEGLLEFATAKELADKYNCHVNSIYRKLRDNGISIRKDIRVRIID